MIFRARMTQSGITLVPYWFPLIGNLMAFAKTAYKMDGRKHLGGNILAQLPFDHCKDHNGILPPAIALNGVTGNGGGLVVFNNAETIEHMLIKNGKYIDKSDDI